MEKKIDQKKHTFNGNNWVENPNKAKPAQRANVAKPQAAKEDMRYYDEKLGNWVDNSAKSVNTKRPMLDVAKGGTPFTREQFNKIQTDKLELTESKLSALKELDGKRKELSTIKADKENMLKEKDGKKAYKTKKNQKKSEIKKVEKKIKVAERTVKELHKKGNELAKKNNIKLK